jgi:XTP/dITP diphosphohydrolase
VSQGGPSGGRVVLLVTSPRVAPGLLSWPAWQRLRAADHVLAAGLDADWAGALAEAGIEPADLGELPVAQRAGRLVEIAGGGLEVVWLGSADGDPGLTDALAEHLSRQAIGAAGVPAPPEIELLTGSHDVQGARLLDLVAVMDRLRSPGGCPWDAEQTHTSLLPFLLEETHEVIEAAETGDREHLREELGDLLLQVVFHARLAEEDPKQPFDVDDVAAGIVDKLIRRHPHVFAGAQAGSAGEVARTWEELKAEEKPRVAVDEGVPAALPALARAQKVIWRLEQSGRLDDDPAAVVAGAAEGEPVTEALLRAVLAAQRDGLDAESLLRAAVRRLAASAPPPSP